MKKIFWKQLIFSVGLLILATPTNAAAISAQKIIASAPDNELDQLEVYSYTIGFKNTGSETWTQSGKLEAVVKTTDRVLYEHWFSSSAWLDKTTVTKSATATVKPGEVGFFTLVLEAPRKAGYFDNHFALFIGGQKISGTDFRIPVTVSSKLAASTQRVTPPTTQLVTTNTTAPTYKTSTIAKAQLMIRSKTSLSLMGGETSEMIVGFKNVGDRNWRNAAPSLVTLVVDPTSTTGQSFNAGWPNNVTVDTLDQQLVENGQLGYFTFKIKAPNAAGTYNLVFKAILNGDSFIPGSQFTLPVIVTVPAPQPTPVLAGNTNIVCAALAETPTNTADPATISGQEEIGTEAGACSPAHKEPLLRVGIASVQGQLGLTSGQPFQIWQDGKVVMEANPNVMVFLSYDSVNRRYTAVGPGPILTSSTPFVAKGAAEPSIITLVTYNIPVAYNPGWNDNAYRGSISIHWSDNDEKLWIINELPLEQYLRGLAEASNAAPMEFQKAQAVAARSYALYHYQTSTKHKARHFHVSATVSDQYYRGYNSELRIPNIGLAAEQTKGQVVTYQGQVVITPYSASSSGTTRTWSEVWGGTDKPWLIKKAVPEDVGRRRFGHAVGMSQLAAQDQAKAGKSYVDILKFFYVNTEVTQWY